MQFVFKITIIDNYLVQMERSFNKVLEKTMKQRKKLSSRDFNKIVDLIYQEHKRFDKEILKKKDPETRKEILIKTILSQ